MKKPRKPIAALLLSLFIILTMVVPALAESSPSDGASENEAKADSTATVNVTSGNPNDTLNMYQVIEVSFDPDKNDLSFEFTELFQNFLDSLGSNMIMKQYSNLGEDGLKQLLGEFTAYIKSRGTIPSPIKTATTDESGNAEFNDVAMGQYIIVGDGSSTGALIYQTVTAEVVPHISGDKYMIYSSYDVKMKTHKPTVEKAIEDGTVYDEDKPTASIGDEVSYKLKIAVPTYPAGATNTTFFVGDSLSQGLRLKADSIIVKGFETDGGEGTILTEDTHYTTDTTGAVGNGGKFYVNFKYDQIKQYTFVTVEYTVTITNLVVIGTNEGNPNDVTLVYSNSPFDGETLGPGDEIPPGHGQVKDRKVVYSYALVINKYDKDNKEKKLPHATFAVYYDLPEGQEDEYVATITTGEDGYASLRGLKAGTYYLVEEVAPTGYNLVEDPIIITINEDSATASVIITTKEIKYTADINEALRPVQAENDAGLLVWFDEDGKLVFTNTPEAGYTEAYVKSVVEDVTIEDGEGTPGAGHYIVNVANSKGIVLPVTGGIGTTIFTIVGAGLMVGAVLVLVARMRMASHK